AALSRSRLCARYRARTPEWEGRPMQSGSVGTTTEIAMTKQPERSVTFSPAELQAVIQQAIADHEQAKEQKSKADVQGKVDAMVTAAFKRKGIEGAVARQNVLTYGKWIQAGFIVKEGERSVTVKQFRLFHESQVRPLTQADKDRLALRR